jgi:large subunit ribosomal protein L10
MPTQRKIDTLAKLNDAFRESQGTVVVDYRGLNVAEMGALRRRLREQSVELTIAKNTLLRRAAVENSLSEAQDLFTGPTAIAVSSDEIAAARMLVEASRVPRTPLQIKGGIFGGRRVSPDEVRTIAEIPSRSALLSQALGAAQAPAASALGIIQAALSQVLYAVNARTNQLEAS